MWCTINVYLNNYNFMSKIVVISLQYAHAWYVVLSYNAIFEN